MPFPSLPCAHPVLMSCGLCPVPSSLSFSPSPQLKAVLSCLTWPVPSLTPFSTVHKCVYDTLEAQSIPISHPGCFFPFIHMLPLDKLISTPGRHSHLLNLFPGLQPSRPPASAIHQTLHPPHPSYSSPGSAPSPQLVPPPPVVPLGLQIRHQSHPHLLPPQSHPLPSPKFPHPWPWLLYPFLQGPSHLG